MDSKTYREGTQTLCDCGHVATAGKFTTGFGIIENGQWPLTQCFECCGKQDAETLRSTSTGAKVATTLYLSKNDADAWEVSNWPGTLKIAVDYVKKSGHNWCNVDRRDVWFTFAGFRFWGKNIGDNQILRVQRVAN